MQKWISLLGMAASASVAYVCYRLLSDDRIDEDKEVRTTKQHEIRFKVPKNAISTVIGRGGENIKRIQQETGCRCNFEDFGDDEGNRSVIIRGAPSNVIEAERVIQKVIESVGTSVEIMIPVESVGFVIGRNGDTIRAICETSKAKVTVSRNSPQNGTHQLVTIRGSFEQIEDAKQMINHKILESEERSRKRKISGSQSSIHSSPDNGSIVNSVSVSN